MTPAFQPPIRSSKAPLSAHAGARRLALLSSIALLSSMALFGACARSDPADALRSRDSMSPETVSLPPAQPSPRVSPSPPAQPSPRASGAPALERSRPDALARREADAVEPAISADRLRLAQRRLSAWTAMELDSCDRLYRQLNRILPDMPSLLDTPRVRIPMSAVEFRRGCRSLPPPVQRCLLPNPAPEERQRCSDLLQRHVSSSESLP
ncbi:MAG: hypothetical protein AAF355_15345 [Myxococcota bacterium]